MKISVAAYFFGKVRKGIPAQPGRMDGGLNQHADVLNIDGVKIGQLQAATPFISVLARNPNWRGLSQATLAALGGGLAIQLFGLTPYFAVLYLVLFLIVVAVGGLGSLKGTLLAALVLGIMDTGGKYLLAEAGGFFIYAVTVVVLLIKPAGFYGRE